MLFAYFGPETMMPMTSVLAVVAGVFMMLGRQAFLFVRIGFRKFGRLVGLAQAPVTPTPKRPISRGSRLDPAEYPIHGSHVVEQVSPQPSEHGESR